MLGTESVAKTEFTIDVIFKNFGSTPAHGVEVVYELILKGTRGPPYTQRHGSVGPTACFKVRETFEFNNAGSDVAEMTARLPKVQVWACVKYKTVFDSAMQPPRETLINLTNGNPIFLTSTPANRVTCWVFT